MVTRVQLSEADRYILTNRLDVMYAEEPYISAHRDLQKRGFITCITDFKDMPICELTDKGIEAYNLVIAQEQEDNGI